MSEDYEALLGKRVNVTTWSGWAKTGTLVAYCERPTITIQDDDGKRTSFSVDAIRRWHKAEMESGD